MRLMKKRIIMSMAMVGCCCLMANAAQTLTINGQKVEKTVARITFSDDNAVLHFADTTTAYPMETVEITFSTETGIQALNTFTINGLAGNELNIGGLTEGMRICIYDAQGRNLVSTNAPGEKFSLNISTLPTGVYILRAGENIIKFSKR